MVGKVGFFNSSGPRSHLQNTPTDVSAVSSSDHSSLAYYPELKQQVENLKYLSSWDDDTTALLKMVAGKLHSHQEVLSPQCDNDRLLADLESFDGRGNYRGAPPYFQEFFLKVAAELERDPDHYQALLSCKSIGKLIAPPLAQDSCSAAARMLSKMAWSVLNKVTEKLVIEAIPLPELKTFKACYEELRSIYLGNYTPQGKLEALSNTLERLGEKLTASRSTHSQEYQPLKGYLETVTPWLKSVSDQWLTLEHSIHELQDNQSALGKVVNLLAMTDTLLSDPQLKAIIDKDRLDSIGQGLSAMRQTLGQVQLWQALPGDVGLTGYLKILSDNPLVQKVLDESTLRLATVLAHVREGYPSDGSLATRTAWLANILANPQLRERLQPHLEMVLGGKPQADQLFAIFQLVGQLRFFPADSSLGGQALWLLTLLSQSSGDTPALEWVRHFQSALGADPATLMLLNRLLSLNQSSQSWTGLMRDLAKEVAPSVGLLAARNAADHLLPLEVAQQLERFYQESTKTESWTDMCKRLAGSMVAIAKPYVVGALMGDPLSAATVRYAEAIKEHTSFDETLRWFVANDPSQDKTLQFAYSQYLNAMLVWQLYQAFNSKSPEETEDTLRQLARQLKDYQVVRSYPQLEKLIDLIPLLPALREARHAIDTQPPANTWLGWCNQWLDTLANSNSKSMLELREQLSRKVENWLADAVMSACNAVVQQPWGLLPGAAAAPTSDTVNRALTTGTTASTPSIAAPSDRANWQLGAGISLEAIGLAAIGYALWRQASKTGSTQDIEMRDILMGSTPARLMEESSPFQAPEGGVSVAALRADKSSLMDQKLPLLLGVTAMAAGGAFLYRWASSGVDGASLMSDSEYQKELKIINELEVPDLSFLFYDELVEAPLEPETTTTAEVETLAEQKANRVRRSTPVNSESIPQHITDLINEAGLRRNPLLAMILRRVDNSAEVINSYRKPLAERNVIRLLKFIEVMMPLGGRVNLDYAPPFRLLLDGLWRIANGLSDAYGQSKVSQFKQAFLIGSTSQPPLEPEATSTTIGPLTDQQLTDRIKRSAERTLQQLEELHHPILDPSAFIDDYLKKGIHRYEQQSGMATEKLPNSQVNVTYHPGPYDPTMVPPYKRAPSSTTVSVPLRDVVTGHYLYNFKQARDSLGRPYSYPRTTFEPEGLINALTRENLQTVMDQALSTYRNNPTNRSRLTSHYENMIKLRCLAYLDSPNKIPAYAQAVKSFLTGSIQAKEMSFRGTKLNGVFLIPSGEAGGVLFSVDEPGFFHIGNQSRTYIRAMGRRVTETTATFPHSDEFKSWVLNKMPSYTAQEYKNRPNSIFESIVVTNAQMNFPTTRSIDRPVSFSETENP
ncbi:hypothetical protein SAMN05660489_03841, partial [Pseudomonas sp. LAMO17WK12:I10]|uniref:hypothetical protein n=1 Tax=unclassified Pseudomonas TaxID=196821 RepID=UPI000BC69A0D